MYPVSPSDLKRRLVSSATSAGNPRLRTLIKYISPLACLPRITSQTRDRPSAIAGIVYSTPFFVKSRKKEFPVPSGKIGRACVGKECRSRWSPYQEKEKRDTKKENDERNE